MCRPPSWRTAFSDSRPRFASAEQVFSGTHAGLRLTRASAIKAERAVSSAVERLLYTQDVGGSIPSPPTMHVVLAATAHSPRIRRFSRSNSCFVKMPELCNSPSRSKAMIRLVSDAPPLASAIWSFQYSCVSAMELFDSTLLGGAWREGPRRSGSTRALVFDVAVCELRKFDSHLAIAAPVVLQPP